MGSLNNLYISQSYQSLVHFATDNTASATLIELEDGLGNGLGVSMNTNGDISASGQLNANDVVINHSLEVTGAVDIYTYFSSSTEAFLNSFQPYYSTAVFVTGSYPAAGGNPPSLYDVKPGWICNGVNVTNGVVLSVSQSIDGLYIVIDNQYPQPAHTYTFTGEIEVPVRITGSLDVSNDITASNLRIKNDLFVDGTIHTPELIATAITSSTIFSSGSNQFGDSINDTQTLIGDSVLSGSLTVDGPIIHRGEVEITGSLRVSGSIYSTQDVSASRVLAGEITASNLRVEGTLTAYEIHTIIESSSVIFSSGSNIFGDSILDIQTLNGTVIVSGSEQVTGSMGISNNLEVKGDISSSTINGIGNVTIYSQSVDARLDYLEGPFSTSVDFRLDNLEAWSSSLDTNFATQAELTTTRSLIEGEMTVTASFLQNQINQKLFTSSFNAYTQSFSSSVAADFTTVNNSINTLSQSVSSSNGLTNQRIDVLSSFTGSYATTGSNTFVGNQTINGTLLVSSSMVYSGSVRGQVFPITIASQTASMDCAKGNFFTVTLPSGSTRLEATNILPGETLSLRITNSTSGSQLTGSVSVKFPNGFTYQPTPVAGTTDIVTFLTFDSSSIYAVGANYFL